MATIRNLKIKTSSCKRIVKELHSYEKEVEREAAKTADMKEKGADPYDLKQQENVLAESRMMIPDCRKRLDCLTSNTFHSFQQDDVVAEQVQKLIEMGFPEALVKKTLEAVGGHVNVALEKLCS